KIGQAVVEAGDENRNPRTIAGKGHSPIHLKFVRQGREVLGEFVHVELEIRQVPLDAHEEPIAIGIGMLVGVQDVCAVAGDEVRDTCHQPLAVGAGDEQDSSRFLCRFLGHERGEPLIKIGERARSRPARVAATAARAGSNARGRSTLCGYSENRKLRFELAALAFGTLSLLGSINQSFELLVALLADVLKNGHQCDSSYIVGNRVVFPSKKIVVLTPDTNAVDGFQPADFCPRRGLGGGHRQTLANLFFPRFLRLPGHEEQLFEVEDGARVLCHCHWQRDRQSALTILIVHGLEGSSESSYVRGTTHKAFSAGMNVVRMNVRNCGGTEHLAPSLYHSGLSADIDAVTRALISEHKLRRLALIGFSMGGNQVLKLAGEWGTEGPSELRAVVAVSPAIDLGPSADALHLP